MKILLSLLLLLAAINMPANANTYTASATDADSVSMLLGNAFGTTLAAAIAEEPEGIDIDNVMMGLKSVMSDNKSYALGMLMGSQLMSSINELKEKNGVDINTSLLMQNLETAVRAQSIDKDDAMAKYQTLSALMQRLEREQLEARENSPEAIAAKEKGNKFITRKLIGNKYVRTESGLMFRVITPGAGTTFGYDDEIVTIYKGKLVDGTVVEDSEGQRTVSPNRVTPGCSEMLQLMRPGMKVEAIIPSDIAYGLDGNPKRGIGPNETLVFEIETIGLETPGEE